MISMVTVAWLAMGTLAGVGHARSLWRSSQHPLKLHFFPLRVACVTTALFAAALLGGILPVFAGWGVGFAAGAVRCFKRMPV